jgi:hypothetical protein
MGGFLSVIIDDFNVMGVTFRPGKADPVLMVDPDAVLPGAVSFEGLQVISGQRQIPQAPGLVELVELAAGGAPDGT